MNAYHISKILCYNKKETARHNLQILREILRSIHREDILRYKLLSIVLLSNLSHKLGAFRVVNNSFIFV